ncbi:hypothetical protein M0805_009360 [Coniferiporia weirii]|nr:hypothetical protein M0805_009360 [Coniferiporia weirii]
MRTGMAVDGLGRVWRRAVLAKMNLGLGPSGGGGRLARSRRCTSTSASGLKSDSKAGSGSTSRSQQNQNQVQVHTQTQEQTQLQPDHSASAKLLADAARSEADEIAHARRAEHPLVARALAEAEDGPWTGEESLRDSVLRMLVDKHRPLRGPVRSAEEKLSATPPAVSGGTVTTQYTPDWRARADAPLLPAVEGHKPWLVTFRAPAHAVASVKFGNIASGATAAKAGDKNSRNEDAERKPEAAARRRSETAQRLGRARESMLDYRLGIRGGPGAGTEGVQKRPMPVGMKRWASLVEERIERARQEGHFRALKGRGKPLVRETAEGNPFIAREEFLMNRIVQRNNAAPPWVELQTELESALSAFRAVLQESWTRRAIRMLTLRRAPESLRALTAADVQALRDAEWEARERGYQDAALAEVNELVRRYNGVAPYAVRRAPHTRDVELARVYRDSAEGILGGVRERLRDGGRAASGAGLDLDLNRSAEGRRGGKGGAFVGPSSTGPEDAGGLGLWDVVRGWFAGPSSRT